MASQENHTHSQPNGLQPPQSAVDEGFLNGQQPVRDVSRQVLDVATGQIIAARGHTQLGENIQARAQGLGTSVVARPPYEKAQYVGDHIPYHRGSDGQNIFDNASLMQEKLQAGLQHIAPLSLTSILATENLKASAQLMEDPIPRQIAFRDLQVWVEGSLDMYKARILRTSLQHKVNLIAFCSLNLGLYSSPSLFIFTWTLSPKVSKTLVNFFERLDTISF